MKKKRSPKKPMIPVTFLAVERHYNALQELAEQTERGIGELLRQALAEFLQRAGIETAAPLEPQRVADSEPRVGRPVIFRDEHGNIVNKPQKRHIKTGR
jgi:hypothetical protein